MLMRCFQVANIQDYMIANIIACFCCCWIIGIFAIIKSNDCKNAKIARDSAHARYNSS